MLARSHGLLLLAVLTILPGCTYRQMLEKIAPKDEVEFAKGYLGDLRAGRLVDAERALDPALVGPETSAKLAEVTRYFPPSEPRSVELIGANVGSGPDWWSANLSFQYEFQEGWLAAMVVLARRSNGPLVVTGVHVERLPDSLQRIHAFTLGGKRASHYLFLVAAFLVAGLVVTMLVVCARAREVRRKWLWVLFILFGVAGVSINWTTGDIGFRPLSVHMFGAGAQAAGPYAPWFVTVSFPLGALLFLAKRVRNRNAPADAAEPVAPTPAA
jgi:hypothetical protein